MDRAKKIGQITWITFPNYGTFLQAYALQYTLNTLGYKSRIIDDRRFTNLYVSPRLWMIKILGTLRHPKRNINWFKSRFNQFAPYNRFKRHYLNIDKHWSNETKLSKRYDGFICGSDQIWSPLLPEHHNGFYFASFAETNKIAYAPSIGSISVPKNQESQYKKWLSGFQSISMREAVASKEINRLTGKVVPTVLDPTLLLTADEWRIITKKPKISKPYILAYFLTYNQKYIEYLHKLAEESGYFLIVLGNDFEVIKHSQYNIENVGPDDFIGLIQNAEYVITDSFHGTIFSIILNKPFVTFKRFKEGDSNNQNSRIENLFNLLGIEHYYSEKDVEYESVEFVCDFSNINLKLKEQRSVSLSVLKRSLEEI